MITIHDFMKAVDFKITDSYRYLWRCYGPDVRVMASERGIGPESITICIAFDVEDQTVYEMEAWDGPNSREYRWIHPDYVKAHKKEAKARGVKHKKSIDDNNWIDLDAEEDILVKARAIFLGTEYDTRVLVPLDLNDEELFNLMRQAHEADMTVNEYVALLLQNEIDRRKDNEHC